MFEYHGPPSRIEMYRQNMERHGLGVYFVSESQQLRPFFSMVYKYLPKGSRLLECGYGPGTLGIYLSCFEYKIVGIDWDQEIIELARETNRRLEGTVDFKVCALHEIDKTFGPDSFDAVISDVTLEHFSDEDIIEALKKQLIVSKLNIFAVHCANIPLKSFIGDGGERLLKPSYWEVLIKKAGGRVIDRFGYGFYHTRLGQWSWRISTIVENTFYRRLARFGAVIGFVVKRGGEET